MALTPSFPHNPALVLEFVSFTDGVLLVFLESFCDEPRRSMGPRTATEEKECDVESVELSEEQL